MQSSISHLDSSEDIIINGEYRILEKLGIIIYFLLLSSFKKKKLIKKR